MMRALCIFFCCQAAAVLATTTTLEPSAERYQTAFNADATKRAALVCTFETKNVTAPEISCEGAKGDLQAPIALEPFLKIPFVMPVCGPFSGRYRSSDLTHLVPPGYVPTLLTRHILAGCKKLGFRKISEPSLDALTQDFTVKDCKVTPLDDAPTESPCPPGGIP